MDEKYLNLIEKLQSGQQYLFLGQSFLKEVTNIFYEKVAMHLHLSKNLLNNIYLQIEDGNWNVDDVLSWMQTEADYITLPDKTQYLLNINWNSVITSSVEYFIEKIFRLGMKEIQPLYQFGRKLPYNFKSKQTLHISYLYGCLNQIEKGDRPPLSTFDLSSYSKNASKLLNQINNEFLTPLGIFIVDGYDCNTDWLKPDVFYALCSEMSKGQVYFFDFKDEYKENVYLSRLVKDEIIIPIQDSLLTFLEKCDNQGLLDNELEDVLSMNDVIISINGKRKKFPQKNYKKTARSFKILDDFMFEFGNDNVDKEEKISMFRDFLYRSSIEPVWQAYYYEMNIERDYEKKAYNAIKTLLKKEGLSNNPIIIFGQTGTGKSVSMGSLAYKVKREKKYPVLYIDGRISDVNYADIQDFCEWCNDTKIVVFWDSSTHGQEVERYIELNDFLASKGKKAVIVGTSYNIGDEIRNSHNAIYIEAPVLLSPNSEIDQFKTTYETFTGEKLDDIWQEKYDNNFLVALYRLLPTTKINIRRGLLGEISVDTIELCELVTLESGKTRMMELLRKCNIPISPVDHQKEKYKINIKKIIQIVSIVGQFGMAVPFEIIFRMLNGEVSYYVGVLLDKIDFLHVETDINGNISIFPRNSLEAQIVANSSMIDMSSRISLILEVIKTISEKELKFLVELLKAIGPNGNADISNYQDYYLQIARTVRELRVHEGVYNSASILQEATYVREYFKVCQGDIIALKELKDAQVLLINEIEQISISKTSPYKTKNIYGQMLIELSSNIGAELKYHCTRHSSISNIKNVWKKLDEYLTLAMIYSPDPYYPVDICAWAINDVLQMEVEEDFRTELIGKLVSVFEKVTAENPDVTKREDYNKRILLVDELENNYKISNQAFDRLIEMKSEMGIYLRARKMVKGVDLTAKIDDDSVETIQNAIRYLEQDDFSEIVYQSTKTVFFLLRLYWLLNAREPLFYSEKKILPFTREIWEKIYFILQKMEELSDEVSSQIMFLTGVCEFHLGKEKISFDRFRNIYGILGAKRPILYYIAADVKNPKKIRDFKGQLKHIDKAKDRATFYIPELRKDIYYYNREFVNRDPEVNEEYDYLHIGFSFMGPRISDIQ